MSELSNRIHAVQQESGRRAFDRLEHAQALYRDFMADKCQRNNLTFLRNLILAVLVMILGWIGIFMRYGGMR